MASSVPQSSILDEVEPEESEKVPAQPRLNLSGAAIFQGNPQGRDPAILLPNQSDDIPLLALDTGDDFIYGSLVLLINHWYHVSDIVRCMSFLVSNFDELLELSQRGDNKLIDLLVGDIDGKMDYSKIAYLNAKIYGLKRIFFGGYFIRGHACILDTISYAVDFRSRGAEKAMFLRHDGFLGALGAFMRYEKHGLGYLIDDPSICRMIPNGAPYVRGTNHGSLLAGLNEKASKCSFSIHRSQHMSDIYLQSITKLSHTWMARKSLCILTKMICSLIFLLTLVLVLALLRWMEMDHFSRWDTCWRWYLLWSGNVNDRVQIQFSCIARVESAGRQ
ncbi:hypothetical protein MKX01_014713 [Papaver californicum]|nr:hypothetical protein MKX01_014713 [Papaver californicum]